MTGFDNDFDKECDRVFKETPLPRIAAFIMVCLAIAAAVVWILKI